MKTAKKTVFTVIEEGELVDTFGSIKKLAASLGVDPNKLYYFFSRKKLEEVVVGTKVIYKTKVL